MPIPKPKKDETKKDYIQRCMVDDVMTYEYEDIDQRLAVCSTHYEKTKLEKGEPHYTKDGKVYTGETHQDASGRLMTGKVHTEDSEYLYHKDELPVELESYTDYPKQATENAKIAIRYAEENGWGGDAGVEWAQRKLEQIRK